MSSYQIWTLTCDGCGEVYDPGFPHRLSGVKKMARREGWQTGKTGNDADHCAKCLRMIPADDERAGEQS